MSLKCVHVRGGKRSKMKLVGKRKRSWKEQEAGHEWIFWVLTHCQVVATRRPCGVRGEEGAERRERERGRCELAFCQTHSSSVRDSASARIISKNTTQICMGDDVDVEEYTEVKLDFASPLNDPSDRYCYEQKVICLSEGYTESFPRGSHVHPVASLCRRKRKMCCTQRQKEFHPFCRHARGMLAMTWFSRKKN